MNTDVIMRSNKYEILTHLCDRSIMKLLLSLLFCALTARFVMSQTIDRDYVQCDVQQKVCECRAEADECDFILIIEELQTFTSYTIGEGNPNYLNDIGGRESIKYREEDGSSYYFNSTGHLSPLFNDDEHVCITTNEDFNSVQCTVPFVADGKTYRSYIAVNGLAPGPTLVVHEGQLVIANVVNRLVTDSITIHWHGIHMRNTPWMDGAVQVTQCPLNPGESFRYYFRADSPGTFWYHSHRIVQRIDGLFGALIILESSQRRAILESALGGMVIDNPGTKTVHLQEWTEETALDLITRIKGGLECFPGKPLGEVPVPASEQVGTNYTATDASSGPDGLEVGPPFWSGLINGKGRHSDVPYTKTRLEIFNISNDGNFYRFRLVGAQSSYAFKFSIDEHLLTVISADSTLIEPVETNFIIIHIGETYDFVVRGSKPRADINDYWIRAETLGVDLDSPGPPYTSLDNTAEGILHYGPDQFPQSSEYESIKQNSIPYNPIQCGALGGCVAVNCPFRNFHPSYNISRCVNVHELRLLEATPSEQLPEAEVDPDCSDCELFFNIGSDHDTMNGRNMQLPPAPPLTQKGDLSPDQFCNLEQPCPNNEPCSCTHLVEINSYNKTIRLVLSSVGQEINNGEGVTHPLHLHGHHFHVVGTEYGSYDDATGFLTGTNDDIMCNDQLCSNPSWAPGKRPSFTISNKTIVKDTIQVPAGGYVVLQFRSDNPGLWLLHCHIMPDLFEGMSVMINMVESRQNPPPDNFIKCGDFKISQTELYEKLAFDPSSSAKESPASISVFMLLTIAAVVALCWL